MFELETSIIFWSIISFAILVLVVAKFALPPILKIMEERQDQIKKDLSEAINSKTTAEKLKSQSQTHLKEARARAEKIITEASHAADRQKKGVIAKAENTAGKIIIRARQQAAHEEEKAKENIIADLSGLIAEVSGKLINKTLTEKEHYALIDKSLTELKNKL